MKKKLLAMVLVAVTAVCAAQIPQAPNLKLNLPPQDYPNWGVLLNQNFSILDTAVGYLQHGWQGPWNAATTYQQNQMVTWNGGTYISLIASNLNQQPDISPAAWSTVGSSTAPPIATIQGANMTGTGFASSGEIVGSFYPTPEAAVAAACASSKSVMFPAGIYPLTTGIKVCTGLTIRCVASEATTMTGTVFRLANGAPIWGLSNPNADASSGSFATNNVSGMHMQNCHFDMSGDSAALGALRIKAIAASKFDHIAIKANNNPNPAITEDGGNYAISGGNYDNLLEEIDMYDVAPSSSSMGTGYFLTGVGGANNNTHVGGRIARFGTNIHIASGDNNVWYGVDAEGWQQYCVLLDSGAGGNKFDRLRCESGQIPWAASTAVTVGQLAIDNNANRERVTVAGTTGATAPTWCTTLNCTTISGTATYTLDRILPADVMASGSIANSIDVYISGYETGVIDTTGTNSYPYPVIAGTGVTGLGNGSTFAGISSGQKQNNFMLNTTPFDTSSTFSGDCADGWFFGCMSVTGYPSGGELQATRAFILCNFSAGCNPIPTAPSQPTATYSRFLNRSTGPQDINIPDNGGVNLPATMQITGQNVVASPLNVATATTNYNSKSVNWQGSYWNGTVAQPASFVSALSMNPGPTPQMNLIVNNTGNVVGQINYFFETNTTGPQGSMVLYNATPATVSNNYPAPKLSFFGGAWNGSATAITSWSFTPSVGAGANPTDTLTLSHIGPGPGVFALPGGTTIGGNLVDTARGIAQFSSGVATVNNAAACTVGASCSYKFTNCGPNASTAIGVPSLGTVTAGTSFLINSLSATNTVTAGDVSSICWQIN